MFSYIMRRVLFMIPTLFLISVVSFIALQLPPGDYLTSYAAQLSAMGESADQEAINSLRERYGLGQPVYVQYGKWVYWHHHARRLGPIHGVAKAGQSTDLGANGADGGPGRLFAAHQLVDRDPRRRLFCHAPVFDPRLSHVHF